MKKISILIGALFCSSALFSQEVLSLKQCREMALQYNKRNGSFCPADRKARDIWLKSYKRKFLSEFLRRVGPVFIAVPVDIMV